MQTIAYTPLMTIAAQFPSPLSNLVWIHVLAGAIALLTFWIPLATKKGGKLHARSGWIFLGALLIVITAALIITPWRYFFDPSRTPAGRHFSLFLFYISIFSGVALQQGIVVFKDNDNRPLHRSRTLAPPILMASVAITFALYAIQGSHWLYLIFSTLGFHLARIQFQFWRKPHKTTTDRWGFHIENMFICCISTVTAFGVTAIPRLIPGAQFNSIGIWIAPALVMVPWKFYFRRKYAKKIGR